ncbi:TRAP transporter small permease subunit [Marimonas lutisalis]|uniref:TRAP transporter small permease subunit n=1 Tax=Marimonas lutisalis TaxID=2545756 RepID=UPI0010F67542|nr:TRAP transporter small permease subunit [Marimonas lutisalis]
MTSASATPVVPKVGETSMIARLFGWGMLGILFAFAIVNVLNVGWGIPGTHEILAGSEEGGTLIAWLIYAAGLGLAVAYVVTTPGRNLRWDAMKIHDFNVYLVRACFWSVLLVGVVDATIALMRVENLLGFLGEDMVRELGRAQFIGPNIHLPLVGLGLIIALFTRTLGFHWLALLIVLAELLIVISRFGFSYEQALMGDLVRYWYAALFLFASAYTLFEDGHVRVDVLYSGFGYTKRGFVNAWGSILLGMSTAWVILAIGFNGKQSIINSPVMNFEVTQSGSTGMYVKYQMAAFLGIFGATMLIQFISYFLESVADWRDHKGRREIAPAAAH